MDFVFLCRESCLHVLLGEPEGRARDPARVTERPALNQQVARCVISHTNTHRLTAHREASGGRGALYKDTFSSKGNRGPKKSNSCGSS